MHEYIYIFFTYEIAARECPWVLVKALTHRYTPKRLAAIHAAFDSRYKRRLVLKLYDLVNGASQSSHGQTYLVLTSRTRIQHAPVFRITTQHAVSPLPDSAQDHQVDIKGIHKLLPHRSAVRQLLVYSVPVQDNEYAVLTL